MTPPPVNVKVSFVMDCTASMGPWIYQAKTRMVDLIDQVKKEHPAANIQVSFVGYRDYGDDEPKIVIPFQKAEDTMMAIRQVEAEGGDDQAEDVVHALQTAVYQDWSDANVKIVFHIADAPAHGEAFHSIHISDRYPRGDPDGLDPRDFVEKMSFLDIHYTFVRIHESTDTMIEQFHNCYVQGGTFCVIDLFSQRGGRRRGDGDPEALSATLSHAITQHITQHYTSSLAP
jgi:hypothetical protein